MQKSDKDEAHEEGYRAGKDGGFLDDLAQSIKDAVPGPAGTNEDTYDKGYRQGQKDRD